MDKQDQQTKRIYTEKEIRDAPKSNDPELEEPIFPYYGVKCVWLGRNGSPARTVEEIYPEGRYEEPMPWERDDEENSEG